MQKQQVSNFKETALEKVPSFLTIKSTKQCPPKGWFPAQRLTRCNLNEKYNLLVEWLGLSERNYPTGYSVSLENLSTQEKYHLFNQVGPLDAPGGREVYNIRLLDNNWIELSWSTGDMGWFKRFFRVIDLPKREMVPLEITVSSNGLTVVKDNKEYQIKLDFDTSNYSYEKGSIVLARDLTLNGRRLNIFTEPISRDFEPYSCMLGCPELYFPRFEFQSRYTKDFSAIIFSLEDEDEFIFYIDDEKVMSYE